MLVFLTPSMLSLKNLFKVLIQWQCWFSFESRSKRSILPTLVSRSDSSKPLNPSSLSSALTFTMLPNARKWLSLGQHVLSLCANAMLRWLYEGPHPQGQSLLGALARVWWSFSIFYTFKWLRRPRPGCHNGPFDLFSYLPEISRDIHV